MKKTIYELLAVTMMLSLTACGSSAAAVKKAVSAAESTNENADETPAEKQEEKKEEKQEEPEVVFKAFSPIDNDECSVTVTELKPDSVWGYTVKMTMENKSSDKTYMFATEGASVNGVDVGTLDAVQIAPGKKSNSEISLSSKELKENGITEFTDIELLMRIYDSDDWSADPVVYESFHIYPFGEDKAEKFVRESKDSDQVLSDNDNVKVIVTGFEDDPIWGFTVKLYLENKTDSRAMFSVEDASVNGYMADPFFAASVEPGHCKFSSVSWSDSILKENGITDVESIEFKLRAYNYEDWMSDSYLEEVFTLNP